MTKPWPNRLISFFLWTLATLSVAYWILKVVGFSEAPIAAAPVANEAPTVATAELARVLGPAAVAPEGAAASAPQTQDPAIKMQLLGVVANRNQAGVALISVEGQIARPYRVGSQVASYTLTQVAARSATLSPTQQGAASITLELASVGAVVAARQATLGAARPAPVIRGTAGVAEAASAAIRPAPPPSASETAQD